MVKHFTLRSLMASRVAAVTLGALLIIGAGLLTYELALQSGLAKLGSTANDRLQLLTNTLDYTVGRHSYLPIVLSQAAPIINAYRTPDDAVAISAADEYLKTLNDAAGSADLFIVDRRGVALAASNFQQEITFVGQSYAFRPYFTEALRTGAGRYYAVGVTTGRPGYFLWHAVPDTGDTIGVAVVKVDLGPLQEDWRRSGALVAMVNSNKVIFLTSRSDWQYRPTLALSPDQVQVLRQTQQYGNDVTGVPPLFSSQHTLYGARVVRVTSRDQGSEREYVAFARPLPTYGWTLLVLTDLRGVQVQAGLAAGGAMLAMLAAMLMFLVTYQRRQIVRAKLSAHNLLEQRVAMRTAQLTAANTQLSVEVEQRIRIEQNLRRTQDNLVHATKMASLGQALAGVAHEINQSLAALGTYIASTRVLLDRSDKDLARSNLGTVSSIIERMGELTQHLKSFARKDTAAKQSTDLTAAIRYGLKLIGYRIKADEVELSVAVPDRPVYVIGNTIRLEQVVVNLISNALDAMRDHPPRRLKIRLARSHDTAVLEVADTGRGIPHDNLSSVFDPFFTTKDVGEGLGLGLSISYGIVKDMGGDIAVESEVNVGTTFRITLPVAAEVETAADISA